MVLYGRNVVVELLGRLLSHQHQRQALNRVRYCSAAPVSKMENEGMVDQKKEEKHYTDFRLIDKNAGILQPVLDLQPILDNITEFEHTMKRRGMSTPFPDLKRLGELWDEAKQLKVMVNTLEAEREKNISEVNKDKDQKSAEEMEALKAKGALLRQEWRKFNSLGQDKVDEMFDIFLKVPNLLDPETLDEHVNLGRQTSSVKLSPYLSSAPGQYDRLFGEENRIATGELGLSYEAESFMIQHGFTLTCNVDFVKRLVLSAVNYPLENSLKLKEDIKGPASMSTYFTGGSHLASFVVPLSQSLLTEPDSLPLRSFNIGRSYSKNNMPTGSHQIDFFIGCRDESELKSEFERMKNVMTSFYCDVLGIPVVSSRIVGALDLFHFERKRLEYLVEGGNSSLDVLGHMSDLGNFLSKRLLCLCCVGSKFEVRFFHMIHGTLLHTSRLLSKSNV